LHESGELGFSLFYGCGKKKNQHVGRSLMLSTALSGDRFFALKHVKLLEFGQHGFPKDKEQAKVFREIALTQNESDLSLF
jgi:hypothetical protein